MTNDAHDDLSPKLIWTRSLADWGGDEALLSSLIAPKQILRLPCLTTNPRTPDIGGEACDYLVYTSAHAVRYSMAHPQIVDAARRARQIFTHGDSTAEALRAAGMHPHLISSARTAADLCAWLGDHIQRPAHFGLPSAAEPAFALKVELEQRGFTASQWVCYGTETAATDHLGRTLSEAAIAHYVRVLRGVICFASPSAVIGFGKIFSPALNRLGAELEAIAIGPTTQSAAAQQFQKVSAAAANTLEAVVKAASAALRSLQQGDT